MGSLRKFEIDAIVATINDKVKKHNDGITLSDMEIKAKTKSECPEILEFDKARDKKVKLEEEMERLKAEMVHKYDEPYTYSVVNTLKQRVKISLLKEKGYKSVKVSDITNKIVIAGSSGNLEEIIEKLTKDLEL